MKKTIILIATLVATLYSYAQVELECKSEEVDSVTITQLPWFGKNEYLTQYRNSLHNAKSCTNCRVGQDGLSKTIY